MESSGFEKENKMKAVRYLFRLEKLKKMIPQLKV